MDGPQHAQLRVTGARPVEVDAPAFEALVAAQLDAAYRLATVILGSSIEAEDAVADAAARAWRSRRDLRSAERFDAWFGRILVNGCRDRLRSRHRRPVTEVLPETAEDDRDGVDFRERVHIRDALSRAFEELPPDDRVVLVLRFWLDLPVDGIATRLAIPAGTVKSRLHHATARLRARLGEEVAS
jgi:RNA polymerase sigma-70 factor (ECF subfamily)